MNNSNKKGNQLEEAVRWIEQCILGSSPQYASDSFLIESKKIRVVNGVRHEVDVFVSITGNYGYDSNFIFECKNWKDPVGKNEIIIFSEKINVFTSQKGFFVAPEFTKDAEAQAALNPRIKLLKVNDLTHIPQMLPTIKINGQDEGEIMVDMVVKNAKKRSQRVRIDISNAKSKLNGVDFNFEIFCQQWVANTCERLRASTELDAYAAGKYILMGSESKTYDNDALIINDCLVSKITMEVKAPVQIINLAVASHYEVVSRGRVISFENVALDDDKYIKLRIVSKNI